MQTWFLLPAPICSASWCWVCPVTGKEYEGWSQVKPIALFKVHSIGSPIFKLNVRLSHIYTFSPHAALTSSERHYSPLIISEKAVYTTLWLTGIAVYLKQRLLSSPPKSAAFFGGHSLHSSLSSLFLPFSSESSSTVGGSVTVKPCQCGTNANVLDCWTPSHISLISRYSCSEWLFPLSHLVCFVLSFSEFGWNWVF